MATWVRKNEPQYEFIPNLPSNVWSAWKATFDSADFKTLSDKAKVNRRRGEPNARPLPTYRGGGLSAARLREQMAKDSGDVDLTPHSMLVRTKGVRGEWGERLLITDIDKQIDNLYKELNDEDLRKGKTPDLNKNYLKAVDLVAKKKRSSFRVYGLGTSDEVFYPERSIFHTPQANLRRELDELHSATNEFRTYINVQMTENNPSANELQVMRNELTSMQEAIRRLESQLSGESSSAGEASGLGAHGGSPGASYGSHNTRASGGSGGYRIRRGGGNGGGIIR